MPAILILLFFAFTAYGQHLTDRNGNRIVEYGGRFDRMRLGIGIMGDYYVISPSLSGSSGGKGFGASIGMVTSVPIVSRLTLNPEFYLTLRNFEGIIEESALNIPVTLKWTLFETLNSIFEDTMYYIEGGVQFGVPMNTSISKYRTHIDRETSDFGIVLGFGGDASHFKYFILDIGSRFIINTTSLDKSTDNSFWTVTLFAKLLF